MNSRRRIGPVAVLRQLSDKSVRLTEGTLRCFETPCPCPLYPKADMDQSTPDVRFVPIGLHRGYSITSSARASSDGGIGRPSALAVLRLITNSYLVGACTGRSAGFSPRKMRSM